jgi:dTDP-4-dehydrorhamnose reductase
MIAIFGAGGQVGQELSRVCAQRGIAACGFTRAEADIADRDAVSRALEAANPRLVINAAAFTKVDLGEQEVEMAARANAVGPAVLAEDCARARVPLIHLSTDYVFDGAKAGPYVETDAPAPLGVYGRTKLAGEEAVRERAPAHVILRTSWVFGRYGGNILKTVLRLADERPELRFVADQHGCPTATADIAEAILAAARRLHADDPVSGTYHFAGSGATTWFGFVGRVLEARAALTGRRTRVLPITTGEHPTPARRPLNSVLDSCLFARTFGLRARPWEERVDEAVRQLLQIPVGAA